MSQPLPSPVPDAERRSLHAELFFCFLFTSSLVAALAAALLPEEVHSQDRFQEMPNCTAPAEPPHPDSPSPI